MKKEDDDLEARLDDELAKMDEPDAHVPVTDWRAERTRRKSFIRAVGPIALFSAVLAFLRTGLLVDSIIGAAGGVLVLAALFALLKLFDSSRRATSEEAEDRDDL